MASRSPARLFKLIGRDAHNTKHYVFKPVDAKQGGVKTVRSKQKGGFGIRPYNLQPSTYYFTSIIFFVSTKFELDAPFVALACKR